MFKNVFDLMMNGVRVFFILDCYGYIYVYVSCFVHVSFLSRATSHLRAAQTWGHPLLTARHGPRGELFELHARGHVTVSITGNASAFECARLRAPLGLDKARPSNAHERPSVCQPWRRHHDRRGHCGSR